MTKALETIGIPMPDTELPADLFSSDVFRTLENPSGTSPAPEVVENEASASHENWTSLLPKVPARSVVDSPAAVEVPDTLVRTLCAAIEASFREVIFADEESLQCRMLSKVDCDLSATSSVTSRSDRVSFPIFTNRTEQHASAVVRTTFIHRIVDRLFGPYNKRPTTISPIEIAIAEFLAARVAGRFNMETGKETISVGEASVVEAGFTGFGTKLLLEVQTSNFVELIELLLPADFIAAVRDLDESAATAPRIARAINFLGAVPSIPLRVTIGSTRVDAASLSFLECGDIVLIEDATVNFDQDGTLGEVRILAGTGNNFSLTGELTLDKQNSNLDFRIGNISVKEIVLADKTTQNIMEDNFDSGTETNPDTVTNNGGVEIHELTEAQESEGISLGVENLQLRLRVELAGKRMTLREINDLRIGQVIDLGRGPNDPVTLVTDGSDEVVATGELVDIEGNLGVRLTKVFI